MVRILQVLSSAPTHLFLPRLCPVCKSLQDAKATTRLSHAPPVLLLQLSRYEDSSNGKKKNLADFPLRDLDISEWMVTQDPEIGGPSADDARAQRPPYRYDLYAVVNHDGQTIDSGHCRSFSLVAYLESSCSHLRYLDDPVWRALERVQ